ncbi:MAG: 7-carboxy-7-deazaguanine synthase [Myxococcota bacterium]|jgi:7-carboxy-7-deazaguanine synthase
MERLLELGHEVLLETSGSRDISVVPDAVHIILDFKAPASGEVKSNLWSNVDHLLPHHEAKFVVADRADYEWSRDIIRRYELGDKCTVLISPAWGLINIATLVDWMLEDVLPARLSIQIHKVVWGKDAIGV